MVLGGQMKEEYTDGENKVPMLGDVPMVGNLFKNSSRERKKSILLVFLRPVVIRDAQAASSLALDRYEAIRAQQSADQPLQKMLMPINESPVLPTLPPKGQPLPTIPMQTPGTAPAAKN
jgi:general secretion pathway protein D